MTTRRLKNKLTKRLMQEEQHVPDRFWPLKKPLAILNRARYLRYFRRTRVQSTIFPNGAKKWNTNSWASLKRIVIPECF